MQLRVDPWTRHAASDDSFCRWPLNLKNGSEKLAAAIDAGGDIISKSTPSMRNRTRSFFSAGSMWISLAPSFTAVWMM